MKLKYYILKRLLLTIPSIFGLLLIVFLLSHVIPGDPVAFIAGRYAGPETIEKITQEYGFDKPLYIQFVKYITNIFQGDLGKSLRTRKPVVQDIVDVLPATLELIMVTFIMVVFFGISLGVISAIKKDGAVDHIVRIFSLIGQSIPEFYLAILLILFFSYNLGVLPTGWRIDYSMGIPTTITGLYIIDSLLTGNIPTLISSIKHMILPSVSLAIFNSATLMRMTRSVMVESLMEDYVRTAKVYGLSNRYINFVYALKPAIAPSITVLGMNLGFMFSGTFVIEKIFDYPGIGRYISMAVETLDYSALMGVALFLGVIFILINLFIDIIYAYLDPRIKY